MYCTGRIKQHKWQKQQHSHWLGSELLFRKQHVAHTKSATAEVVLQNTGSYPLPHIHTPREHTGESTQESSTPLRSLTWEVLQGGWGFWITSQLIDSWISFWNLQGKTLQRKSSKERNKLRNNLPGSNVGVYTGEPPKHSTYWKAAHNSSQLEATDAAQTRYFQFPQSAWAQHVRLCHYVKAS